MRPHSRKRWGLVASVATLSLLSSASPAGAAVTIGQTAPPGPATQVCPTPYDQLNPTVTSGNSFVSPVSGTITSWSVQEPSGGQMTMKVFRPLGGLSYQVVGHQGPHNLSPGLNTFPANVPVKAGDVLGSSAAGFAACAFAVPGETYLYLAGDLPDGAQGTWLSDTGARINISAVVDPTNTFQPGATSRNKKKGTATVSFDLPNPGELSGTGKGAKVSSAGAPTSRVVPAGTATLKVKAKGKKRRTLDATGKVKLKLSITYTPTGGDPATQQLKVKLRKR